MPARRRLPADRTAPRPMSLHPAARALGLVLFVMATGLAAIGATASVPVVIDGVVSSVVDGDSLWLTPARGGGAIEVRLAGIDAPEICQPGGPEARAFLAGWVLKKPARLRVGAGGAGVDAYGRRLGTLQVDGTEVNRRLVEQGHAWSVRRGDGKGPHADRSADPYSAPERQARALRRGLHQAGGAEHPRDFRRRHGPCPRPEGAAAPSPRPAPAAAAASPASGPWRCDGRTQCSQMRSCAEATWFLRHCTGTVMDGDGDGVPCEQQWCRP